MSDLENSSELVGGRVAARRVQLKLSQNQLAELSGLSSGHISMIENGGRLNLQIGTLAKLAKALNVSVDELMGQG